MKKKLLSVLLLAAAALTMNACSRDDSGSADKGQQSGATQTRPGSNAAGKATEGAGSDLAQRGTSGKAGGAQNEQTGSGAQTAAPSDSAPSADETSKAASGSGTDTAQSSSGATTSTQSQQAPGSDTQLARGNSGTASQSQAGRQEPSEGQQNVRQVQQALKEQGQDPGPIDGIVGPRTRQAIREFQEANGLKPTGNLDAQTQQRLNIDSLSSGK